MLLLAGCAHGGCFEHAAVVQGAFIKPSLDASTDSSDSSAARKLIAPQLLVIPSVIGRLNAGNANHPSAMLPPPARPLTY
jgi:hypothetical protein